MTSLRSAISASRRDRRRTHGSSEAMAQYRRSSPTMTPPKRRRSGSVRVTARSHAPSASPPVAELVRTMWSSTSWCSTAQRRWNATVCLPMADHA
jgi:hypothetical protein